MTDQQIAPTVPAQGRRFRAYSAKHLDGLIARAGLDATERLAVRAVATVLPFRTNEYVVESLIDWAAAPDDPIYRLVFPQSDMLSARDIGPIADLLSQEAPAREIQAAAHEVRMRLNPHPAGQLALNIPAVDDEPLPGVQHKYAETVLVFPKQGQTCHAYCTYCFRWAQFVDEPDLKIATDDIGRVVSYLRAHREATSVLLTGGDPMIMSEGVLRRYIEPLLGPGLEHIESIRIGTKSLGLLAAAICHRPGCRRHPAAIRGGSGRRKDAGPDGALLASARAGAADGGGGRTADPGRPAGSSAPRRR